MHIDIVNAWLSDLTTASKSWEASQPRPKKRPVADAQPTSNLQKRPRHILASIDSNMNSVSAKHSKRLGRRGQNDDPKTAIIPPEPTPISTRTSTRASTRTPSLRKRNRSTRRDIGRDDDTSQELAEIAGVPEGAQEQDQDQEQDNCPTIRGRKVATQIRKTHDSSGRHSNTEEQHGRDDDDGDDDACLEDEEEEGEKTPRLDNLSSASSSFRKALFTHPNPSGYSLPFRLPASLSSSSMASSGRSPRSKSPVKSVQDLQALERPVYWSISASYKASRRTIEETNANFLTTFDQVRRIISGEAPFLPLQLRDELEQDDDFEDQPDSAYTTYDEHDGNNETRLRHLQYALHEIRDIVSSTNQCQMLGRAEPAWNELVHGRVLRLATRHSDSVQAENITRATIARPFIPNGASSDAIVSGKIVDYALALQLPPKDPLRRQIAIFLQHTSPNAPMINQTTYSPLQFAPAGVFVETKAESGSREEGRTQLGLWVAAWYKRVEALTNCPPRLPILPLLLVAAETWELFFACCREDMIEVVGPLKVGSTASLHGVYRLLAVVEALVRWVERRFDGGFRGWVEGVVGFKAPRGGKATS